MKWAVVKNFEGFYEVSNTGLVRSINRIIVDKNGKIKPYKGRLLTTTVSNSGYFGLKLHKDNKRIFKYIHRLVCEAFVVNPNNLLEVNHIDGNKLNNTDGNLEWVTRRENNRHAIQSGLRTYSARLTKEEFVLLLDEVISGKSYASLCDILPYKVSWLSTKLRQIAKDLNRELELDAALKSQDAIRKNETGKLLKTKLSRSIAALNPKTRDEIKIFESLEKARIWIGAKSSGSISNAARGKQNTAGGYAWKYL